MASPQLDLGLTVQLPAAMAEQLRKQQYRPPLVTISTVTEASASATAAVLVPLRTRPFQSPGQSQFSCQLPQQQLPQLQQQQQQQQQVDRQRYDPVMDTNENDRNNNNNDNNSNSSDNGTTQGDETIPWEDIMQILPLPNEAPKKNFIDNNNNHNDDVDDNDGYDDDMKLSHYNTKDDTDDDNNNEDDISLSPPPTLPLLLVDLQALCGFIPTTRDEKRELEQQIHMTLTQEEDEHGTDSSSTTIYDSNAAEDRIAQHFHQRAAELLENFMAIHGDTSTTNTDNLRYAIIPYPEYLVTQGNTLVVTAQEWKRLLQPHKVPVVATIISHLVACSQSLLWKIDMAKEIRQLAKHELHFQQQQNIAQQLLLWKTTARKEQLDKLYQVRETFDHRLEVARQGFLTLDEQLNQRIAQEWRQKGYKEGWDAFDITDIAFPRDGSATVLNNNDNENHDDLHDIDNTSDAVSTDDGSELLSDQEKVELQAHLPSIALATLPSISKEARAKARRQATIKKRRRKLHQQDFTAKLAIQEERYHQAMVEEERIRDMCTTQDYRMAQAVVKSLEVRLQQVDDLLESLQEEEWADEEEGEQEEEQMFHDSKLPNECSVLDRILAMILGTLPTPHDTSPQDHFCCIKTMHTSLVNEWEAYFGRLPPLPFSKGIENDGVDTVSKRDLDFDVATLTLNSCQSSEETEKAKADAFKLRAIMGITDVNDEWDDLEESDMILPPAATTPQIKDHLTSTTMSSLRPGGKVT